MDTAMFCFQCEQTAGCTGCTGKAGVCGKPADVANLQDALTGALVGLARAAGAGKADAACDALVYESLFACVTNVDFDAGEIERLIDRVRAEAARLADGDAPAEYDVAQLWEAPDDVRSLKSLVLFGVRGMAAYAYHALALGYADKRVAEATYEALRLIGENASGEDLLAGALAVGEANLVCMELLDRANTETFGNPAPATVPLNVEPGPFIVVTGHDLHDLAQLLEQVSGTGVAVYTHGEMLPAHGYPELRRYPELKGHFGTAWQNQQREFDGIPAPVLFTTNCLMPPRESYADRVYATGPVAYPGVERIFADGEGKKDFSAIIERARALGGYEHAVQGTGSNGGTVMTTGFGREAVLDAAPAVIDAVKSGDIGHFFLVGGCDGARPGRSYFADFVRQTPDDSVVLTLACGKFRFNDLDLGTIGGLPRLLDMGQCNDAYGAVRVALALADAFDCSVNDLPLTLVLSWYEQKAVCILLSLLHLGIKGIYLGPTLPAFLSEGVLSALVEGYDVHPVSTPEADLAAILGK